MKAYNYYYNNIPIAKMAFINSVPKGWESEVDHFGGYTYGNYRAEERDIN